MKRILLMTHGYTNGSRLDNRQLLRTRSELTRLLSLHPIEAAAGQSCPSACVETAHEASLLAKITSVPAIIPLIGPGCTVEDRWHRRILEGVIKVTAIEKKVSQAAVRRIFLDEAGTILNGGTTLVVCPASTNIILLQAFGIKTDADMRQPLSCVLLGLEEGHVSLERVVPIA